MHTSWNAGRSRAIHEIVMRFTVEVFAVCLVLTALFGAAAVALGPSTKTERFDTDPGWEGRNHRSAREIEPVTIRQDFGFSTTSRAGGRPGEIGGFITPAGERAYYAKPIPLKSLDDPLRAEGSFASPDGAYHLLLGFFNSETANEWRTPNTIAIRLNGRGDHFYAYVEYMTSKWRAGGDTTPFPSRERPATGGGEPAGFPSGGRVYRFGIEYDPSASEGRGAVVATIGDERAVAELAPGHRLDGAFFNRFGILTVTKSADTGGEVYFDNFAIDGERELFDEDPLWDGKGNRRSYTSRFVRPRFDFGFSPTHFARGATAGELGGRIFRGDCRDPGRLASYGDRIGPLSLDRPIHAEGKVAMTRGVSDSTTLFGFYSSTESTRRNDSQSDAIPESVAGIHIEGPSSEGFFFYPVYRAKGGSGHTARPTECPRIYPDGASHSWTFDYDPGDADGKGRITISLDGERAILDLDDAARASGTQLDRFGIVTSWIDGNSQDVYWDDVTYTVSQ